MKLTAAALDTDFSEIQNRICNFIKDYVKNANAKGIVLGLSGGIDSSTTAVLSSLAIGGEKVLGLIIPEKETVRQKDIDDAKAIAKQFNIQTQICDITEALNNLYKSIPILDQKEKLCKGNIKARARMIVLYYYANIQNRIVCGSSDKSETLMGYFTKWGDAAADITPIIDLYKTQVRKLALHIGIPRELALKPSTPALWPDQFAEAELGIKYEILDLILYGLERFMKAEEIEQQLKIDKTVINSIKNRLVANEHKRRMPMAPKLAFRTPGNDFRIPRNIIKGAI
ncbi:MAG: NAD+ synthase [Candidatus Bathyarchaeota archaeon]|nr:NAD+ synthase [Candidatus Bathyarchaeota archaeon]MDD4324889.1 NAD+ synthase [Candidatus Bathyarchaeota archaeon]MDI9578492.1 NAD+ synthase [Thermoproteota archaeon]